MGVEPDDDLVAEVMEPVWTADELEKLLIKAVNALTFYADPSTYVAIGFFPDPPNGDFMEDFGETGLEDTQWGVRPGELARKTLMEIDVHVNGVEGGDEDEDA